MNKRQDKQKGAVAAVMLILLPVVVGGLGLVVDNGHMYDVRRTLQDAADAAAVAAAQEVRQENWAGFKDAAKKAAEANGIEADTTVEVYHPPVAGTHKGRNGYVQVAMRRQASLYFMKVFAEEGSWLSASATAGVVAMRPCLVALDPSASPALAVAGTAEVTLDKCGVTVNSGSITAARTMGGGTVNAASIGIAGDYSGVGFSPTPETGISPQDDPLADLLAPPIGACDSKTTMTINSDTTLNPGVYCGGIDIKGGKTTFKPGVYILNGGGMRVSGNASALGTEVMFYNTGKKSGKNRIAPIEFGGTTTQELSAPTSGPFAGILFFQDRDVNPTKPHKLAGTPSSALTGALYFPGGDVVYSGTAGMAPQNVILVASTVSMNGTVNFAPINDGLTFSSPHLVRAALVD